MLSKQLDQQKVLQQALHGVQEQVQGLLHTKKMELEAEKLARATDAEDAIRLMKEQEQSFAVKMNMVEQIRQEICAASERQQAELEGEIAQQHGELGKLSAKI